MSNRNSSSSIHSANSRRIRSVRTSDTRSATGKDLYDNEDTSSISSTSQFDKEEWNDMRDKAGLPTTEEEEPPHRPNSYLAPDRDHLYSMIEPPERGRHKKELFGLAKSFPQVTRVGYKSKLYDYLKAKADKTEEDYNKMREEERRMDAEANKNDRNHIHKAFKWRDFGPFYRLKTVFHAELAEFLGMFVFLCIGFGSSCQAYLGGTKYSNYATVAFAWGFGNMAGIYVAGGYSGAHLNPIVTLNLWFFRGFPFRRMFSFWLAQLLGALSAAAWIFVLYYPALRQKEPDGWTLKTGQLFYATLQSDIPVATAWFNEVTGSALLHCIIFAVGDSHNIAPARGMNALVLGFTVMAIGSSFGYLSAFGLNPARDLGPRMFLAMAGIPNTMWTGKDWWWVTGEITGPLLGGVLGAFAYDLFLFDGPESPINFPNDIKVRAMKFLLDDVLHPFRRPRNGIDRFRRKKDGNDQLVGKVNLEGQPAGQQHII